MVACGRPLAGRHPSSPGPRRGPEPLAPAEAAHRRRPQQRQRQAQRQGPSVRMSAEARLSGRERRYDCGTGIDQHDFSNASTHPSGSPDQSADAVGSATAEKEYEILDTHTPTHRCVRRVTSAGTLLPFSAGPRPLTPSTCALVWPSCNHIRGCLYRFNRQMPVS